MGVIQVQKNGLGQMKLKSKNYLNLVTNEMREGRKTWILGYCQALAQVAEWEAGMSC